MTRKVKPSLGKGLNSMLGGELLDGLSHSSTRGDYAYMLTLPLDEIRPNPNQPRRSFDKETLSELSSSIKTLGVIQPITVRKDGDHTYIIISGERRYQAAKLAGLSEIPAYIREVTETTVLELALVENIQREDLNAIDIALAYQELVEQTGYTHEAIAERVGKKRATVSNYLRLLRLPAEIQLGLNERKLDMGHARALLQVEDHERQIELYHLTIQQDLSVREVEELAKAIKESKNPLPVPQATKKAKPENSFLKLEQHLRQVFGTPIRFKCNREGKGTINIPFSDERELERLISLLERIQ